MKSLDVEGVIVKPLRRIADDRGYLMECIRSDDPLFKEFGQVYVSAVYQDVIKAWHFHELQTDFVICVSGMIKLGVYDARVDSPTFNISDVVCIGDQNPCMVVIPKGVYHGWMGLTPGLSIVMNCPDKLYNYEKPDEQRIPADGLPVRFDWRKRDG